MFESDRDFFVTSGAPPPPSMSISLKLHMPGPVGGMLANDDSDDDFGIGVALVSPTTLNRDLDRERGERSEKRDVGP